MSRQPGRSGRQAPARAPVPGRNTNPATASAPTPIPGRAPVSMPNAGHAFASPSGSHSIQPPWTFSQALGGEYVYSPARNEIWKRDGNHFPRPPNIPVAALSGAIWKGALPPPSATTLPQYPFQGSKSPPTADFNRLNVHQNPVGQGPVQVVFHRRTQSQIQRREHPSQNAITIPISNSDVTSSLFKSFQLRNNGFFKVGRVFLVLWSEPAGGASLVTNWEQGTVLNQFGESVFSKVRRFVVVRNGGNYSNCLPINTYSGRGVSKRGVIKSEHAIIFTGSPAPGPRREELPARGETGMRTVAFQVDPDARGEVLDPMSRLDFGGVTRVQHNIKVKPFGMINTRYLPTLQQQYDSVHRTSSGPSGIQPNYALARQPADADADDSDEDDAEAGQEEGDDDQEESEDGDDDDDDEDEDEDEDDDDDDENDDGGQQYLTYRPQ